ncbi:MAG: ABC transporter substrate-binding protein [Candidatus Omnitrophica bacterium]|nr:ABC transporter substrate-binding protein [Candidatus Omnitrophota bacterium]
MRIKPFLGFLAALLVAIGLFWASRPPSARTESRFTGIPLRVGHFPNVNHAQALVGQAADWFGPRVGRRIEWKAFNAGPSSMEALLAGAIDLSYVGPNPAVNAYLRSQGKALRIVAGATSGGASLIVRKGANLRSPGDFRGKRVASPELGNTQDVALRHWLKAQALEPGKDVAVIPVKNPDILTLFQRGELDAAWVPEPWATRLISEGGGELYLDERDLWKDRKFPTAVLVVRAEFLKKNRLLVKRFIAAHQELTDWIHQHPEEARGRLNETLGRLAGKPLPISILNQSLERLDITVDPVPDALITAAGWARELGYLPLGSHDSEITSGAASSGRSQEADLQGVFDLSLLNEILSENKRKESK